MVRLAVIEMSEAVTRNFPWQQFPSLNDYLMDIKSRFRKMADDEDSADSSTVASVVQWMNTHNGLISMCMVVDENPILINHIRYTVAIQPLKRKVIPACDINGIAVSTLEKVYRSYDDSDKIAQITAPGMDPFTRARWVVENPDAYRLIGEMMMMEKREFFWCFLHGMMLTVGMDHHTFASCRYNHLQVGDGSYDFWPTIIPDANTVIAQLKGT